MTVSHKVGLLPHNPLYRVLKSLSPSLNFVWILFFISNKDSSEQSKSVKNIILNLIVTVKPAGTCTEKQYEDQMLIEYTQVTNILRQA